MKPVIFLFWINLLVTHVRKTDSAIDDIMYKAEEESKKFMLLNSYLSYPSEYKSVNGFPDDFFTYQVDGREETFAIFQYDMLLQKEQYNELMETDLSLLQHRSRRNAIKNQDRLWQDGKIPYTIDNSFNVTEQIIIRDAIDMWSGWTCLSFFKAMSNDYNRLNFEPTDMGCGKSMIGMVQGKQSIYLSHECSTNVRVVAHEIGHAIGLLHEQMRYDRDEYVTVHRNNIMDTDEARINFDVMTKEQYQDFSKPYDYLSIMHYGKLFFSRNKTANLVTLFPKNESYLDVIGEVQTLSYYDVKIVCQLYNCSARCTSTCSGTGFMGAECRCMCRGPSDDNPIRHCQTRKSCSMPTVDFSKYDLLDTHSFETIPQNSGPFNHGTTFEIAWNDIDTCGNGGNTFLCQNGEWIGDLPECHTVKRANTNCSDIKDFPGRVKYLKKGSTVKFKCSSGFKRYGSRKLICQRNGSWNGETPVCLSKGCVPVDISDAHKLNMSKRYRGALLTFSCDDDYMLIGNKEVYCNGRVWSSNIPQCTVERPEVTVIVRETSYTTIAGQSAVLECYTDDVTGHVTLFWSRPSVGLPTGSSQDNGFLTIPNVQPSYAGNYVCTGKYKVMGRVGYAVAILEVNVEQITKAPLVKVEPSELTVAMGTTGTLRCLATGIPEPTVIWIRSRRDISANHQVIGNVLHITEATMDDRGIYVCRATNSAGSDQGWSTVEVERHLRAKIDIYPNATQVLSVGSSALFQCRVMNGDPLPTITWSRVGGEPMSEKIELMDNGVIMFKHVTQAEQGAYMCTVNNDMDVITATATLHLEGPPTITITPSKTVYALIGQRVTLECYAEGDPTPSVYWIHPTQRRRGNIWPESSAFLVEHGSVVLDINNVDREDEGTYRCVATNAGGRTEDRVQLVIREQNNQGVSIRGPSTLSVVEGQIVELICSSENLREAVIRWRRRNGNLPPGHSVSRGVLTLPAFRSEYAGEYICSTTIVPQRQSYEASVFIIVQVTPRLTITPQRITTRAGETIQLRCTALGTGPFNIEWSRVGGQMNPRSTEREGILEIRQVSAVDAGRYICVVDSSAGYSDGYAIVEVEVPPSVIVSKRDVYSQINTMAELRCDVTGSPAPTVQWSKENGDLPSQHRIKNGVLTIYNVQSEDGGRYICSATSQSGTGRDYAVLHVESGPDIDNTGNTGNVDTQIVNVGDRVSMECIVTGTPIPTITWTRDDGPLPRDVIIGDGILIIPQAKIEDAGTYTCHATNKAESISSKVVLFIRALRECPKPASFNYGTVEYDGRSAGSVVRYMCDDGYIIEGKNDRKCLVTGKWDSEMPVCIKEPAPIVRIEPRYQTVDEGSKVKFICLATGSPAPKIEWYRGRNRELNPEATVIDGVLTVPRAKFDDQSDYFCRATNKAGTIEVRTILYITRAKTTTTTTPSTTSVTQTIPSTSSTDYYDNDACGIVITKDGHVIDDGEFAFAVGGKENQVYCDATCSGSGMPHALQWFKHRKNGSRKRILKFSSKRIYSVRTTHNPISILTISNMLGRDTGKYTCKGWLINQGWVEKSIYLRYSCGSSSFMCDGTRCMNFDLLCDGVSDCRDGTDERSCACDNGFKCEPGVCIDLELQCDGFFDCQDGSDEASCTELMDKYILDDTEV